MENNAFEYTYSAQQQKEVEAIRSKYLPKEADKMEQLRKLHRIPGRKAAVTAIILGVMGALILGTGMSLIMTEIGALFGLADGMAPGILIGLMGLVLAALAYPAYHRVLKKERERVAPEILRLSGELLK